MDLLVIELILWAGLLFFFWALKDGLGRVESDLESLGLLNGTQSDGANRLRFVRPERVAEPIGTYKDEPIYRYAYFDGQRYQFDHVLPADSRKLARENAFCLEPGLVYVWCGDQPGADAQST